MAFAWSLQWWKVNVLNNQVEAAVRERQLLRPGLLEADRASRASRRLGLPHHLRRRVHPHEVGARKASSGRTEEAAGSTAHVEDRARAWHFLTGEVEHRPLHGFEDDPLHPVAVVGRRSAVEALDVPPTSHRPILVNRWLLRWRSCSNA